MQRKTVTYLNQLKKDLNETVDQLIEASIDVSEAAEDMIGLSVHDLVTNDVTWKENYEALNNAHLNMAKLLKEFRKARANYLGFF